MRYVLLLAHDPERWNAADAVDQDRWVTDHGRFEAYVSQQGRVVASSALAGVSTATTIRHDDGAAVVVDGPFAELVEQIAGYYDIEVPSLDQAIAAAKLLPACYLVEVRPTIRPTIMMDA